MQLRPVLHKTCNRSNSQLWLGLNHAICSLGGLVSDSIKFSGNILRTLFVRILGWRSADLTNELSTLDMSVSPLLQQTPLVEGVCLDWFDTMPRTPSPLRVPSSAKTCNLSLNGLDPLGSFVFHGASLPVNLEVLSLDDIRIREWPTPPNENNRLIPPHVPSVTPELMQILLMAGQVLRKLRYDSITAPYTQQYQRRSSVTTLRVLQI